MIVFDLLCSQQHRFEGWFASGTEYDRQVQAGLLRCPICDDAAIERQPSARVSVPRAADQPVQDPPAQQAVAGLPAEVVRKLREIVRNTENVGRQFPEEARRIHYEEVPARAIRGQASREEADALREEGIDFAPLPDFLTSESH